jgi:hypothetical protein
VDGKSDWRCCRKAARRLEEVSRYFSRVTARGSDHGKNE